MLYELALNEKEIRTILYCLKQQGFDELYTEIGNQSTLEVEQDELL